VVLRVFDYIFIFKLIVSLWKMEFSRLSHLETLDANERTDPDKFKVVERAEVVFANGAEYMLYVVGLRRYKGDRFDIIHAISSKEGKGFAGLKFCPLEDVIRYRVLVERNIT